MKIVKCTQCQHEMLSSADKCPMCAAEAEIAVPQPEKKKSANWPALLGGLIAMYLLFSLIPSGPAKQAGGKVPQFGELDALFLCQKAIQAASLDPSNASVPYVPNMGGKSEFYFAWGPSTTVARMRNGLGIDVATSASCTVSPSSKMITSLSINGKSVL